MTHHRTGISVAPRLVCCAAIVFAVVLTSEPATAQITFGRPTGPTLTSKNQFRGSGRVASLSDQLKAGLKARRQVEFQFLNDVVKLVEQRKLPVNLVVQTFEYARRKRTNYPFQYFQRALAFRAARIGVNAETGLVDTFDAANLPEFGAS